MMSKKIKIAMLALFFTTAFMSLTLSEIDTVNENFTVLCTEMFTVEIEGITEMFTVEIEGITEMFTVEIEGIIEALFSK